MEQAILGLPRLPICRKLDMDSVPRANGSKRPSRVIQGYIYI